MSSDKVLRIMNLQLSRSVLKYYGRMFFGMLAIHRPKMSRFLMPSVAGIKASAAKNFVSRTTKYQTHTWQMLYDFDVLCI